MISQSAEDTAHYTALFTMACCELVKVNLTIIIIQRIIHAFDCTFDKSNVYGSHSNANAFTISQRHLNAHSSAQHSNAFAFVNMPEFSPQCTNYSYQFHIEIK